MTRMHLLLIFYTVVILILLGFLYFQSGENKGRYEEHQRILTSLNDSISLLQNKVTRCQEEISKIDLRREQIHKETKIIIKENEKIDAYLANGDWDYNIRFLTEFLSRKDSISE